MVRNVLLVLVACAVVAAGVPVWAQGGAAAQPAAGMEAGQAAAAYANAVALGNTTRGWQLLSAKSQNETDAVQWTNAYEQRSPAKPRPDTVLRALCSAPQPPVVGDQIVRADEAFVEVKGKVPVTQQVVVVKEAAGWRVDLAATDALNAQQAAGLFLKVMREETIAGNGTGARTSDSADAVLRALLISEAKSFHAVDTTPESPTRATVTLEAEVPLTLVLRATRAGAGWAVDLYRPLAPGDLFSPEPLQDAASAGERQACETQLRLLAQALDTYCARSDDQLPDPEHWYEQLAPYLPPGTSLHCPADAGSGVSYAMNQNLAGKRRWEVADPEATPVFYESSRHGENPADIGQSWPNPARHSTGNYVMFLDKTVKPATSAPLFAVKLLPPGTKPPVHRTVGPSPMRMPGAGPLRAPAGRPGMSPMAP